MDTYLYVCVFIYCLCDVALAQGWHQLHVPAIWPLHDIATANLVWCMAYTRGVGWGSYIAHQSCNSIAIV